MQRTRLVVVAGAGHSVPGDSPDAFTEAVQEFLGDLERGQFEPATAAPPPLERLLEEHSAARRRGSSLAVMVAAGVVAMLGIAGAGYLFRRKGNKRKQHTLRARANQAVHTLPAAVSHVDVDQARERAAEVVARLGVVGARSTRRARKSLSEVDLESARHAAQEALLLLGEKAKPAATTGREAIAKVDKKKLRKRSSRAMTVAKGAGSLALRAAGRKPAPKPRHRVARWRN
jgi:hypothetical protein